jgi:epoxyqueuosine reductase
MVMLYNICMVGASESDFLQRAPVNLFVKDYSMMLTISEKNQFEANPASFIEKAIKEYVAGSPSNRFSAFSGEPIWDEPLVGFADGDDPLFKEYKTVVGDFHVTPREALNTYVESAGIGKKEMSRISVISWILPATEKSRLSMRNESTYCSLRWNHVRWEGQDFNYRLARYLVALIEGMGHLAVAPDLSKWFEVLRLPNGPASRWSQRHIAYAAGLGTFSLNDGFITPKGMAVRAGSVVCDLALPASHKPYRNHLANCLFYNRGACGKCIKRCPAQAISEKGHDKIKCQAYLNGMKEIMKNAGKLEGYIGGTYVGCGFCQIGVPCENRIPVPD